jgi:hypothetical protein
MFSRPQFTNPRTRKESYEAARKIWQDDVASTAHEIVEGLTLSKVSFDSPDASTAKLWSVVARQMQVRWFFLSAMKELRTIGCVTVATWWGPSSVSGSGKGPSGQRRSRPKSRTVPQRLVILNAEKVYRLEDFWSVPKLVYFADPEEAAQMDLESPDDTMSRLIAGPYRPADEAEEKLLTEAGGVLGQMFLLKPDSVWQYRLPGTHFGNCIETPSTPLMPLLEMKSRLMDSDRASLIAAANFILIFKVGNDLLPATQDEVDEYRDGMVKLAKMPVIVGDHRLDVQILAPSTDAVLNHEKYQTLDLKIGSHVLGLVNPELVARGSDGEMVGKMLTARLESQRRTFADQIESSLVYGGPSPYDLEDADAPQVTFTPRAIPLVGVDAQLAAVLAARARNDLSRGSYLETLGYDQELEFERRQDEAERFDETFQTHQPFDSPQGSDPATSRQPANNPAPGAGRGKSPAKTAKPPGGTP